MKTVAQLIMVVAIMPLALLIGFWGATRVISHNYVRQVDAYTSVLTPQSSLEVTNSTVTIQTEDFSLQESVDPQSVGLNQ
jgi:hypothetical protein